LSAVSLLQMVISPRREKGVSRVTYGFVRHLEASLLKRIVHQRLRKSLIRLLRGQYIPVLVEIKTVTPLRALEEARLRHGRFYKHFVVHSRLLGVNRRTDTILRCRQPLRG
jgi:hypothetical protein